LLENVMAETEMKADSDCGKFVHTLGLDEVEKVAAYTII
jgi:hypothetical protein